MGVKRLVRGLHVAFENPKCAYTTIEIASKVVPYAFLRCVKSAKKLYLNWVYRGFGRFFAKIVKIAQTQRILGSNAISKSAKKCKNFAKKLPENYLKRFFGKSCQFDDLPPTPSTSNHQIATFSSSPMFFDLPDYSSDWRFTPTTPHSDLFGHLLRKRPKRSGPAAGWSKYPIRGIIWKGPKNKDSFPRFARKNRFFSFLLVTIPANF